MTDTPLYPLFLQLRNLPVLIVGGGSVAARKAAGLLDSHARITIISPEFHADLQANKKITKRRTAYTQSHITQKPWRLVFAATDNPKVNAQVQKDARTARILCCRCDEPDRGDFTNGSVAHLGHVTLALSTSGASPTLAHRLREQALNAFDPTLLQLADLHRLWRAAVKKHISSLPARSTLLKRLAGEEMEAHLRLHGPKSAQKLFAQWLAASRKKANHAR